MFRMKNLLIGLDPKLLFFMETSRLTVVASAYHITVLWLPFFEPKVTAQQNVPSLFFPNDSAIKTSRIFDKNLSSSSDYTEPANPPPSFHLSQHNASLLFSLCRMLQFNRWSTLPLRDMFTLYQCSLTRQENMWQKQRTKDSFIYLDYDIFETIKNFVTVFELQKFHSG